jgi:hypothetical protein
MADVANNTVPPSNALALWTGILAGPVAWLLQMQTGYALVPWACATGHVFVLHLVTLAGLLIAAAGALLAWRDWRRFGKQWPQARGGPQMRRRFMAVLGLLTSVMFFFVILAQGIPSFILNPCQP